MVEVTPDPKPASEGGIGRPKARARSRARTHRTTWTALHAQKGGACRVCGEPYKHLHHLYSRARAGQAINEPWNLAPLCDKCHKRVTDEDPAALRALAAHLLDDEHAGLAEVCGENFAERLFGVRYENA